MAFNRMSVATISSPEFINIEGISPFASKCEIKVLYIGGNRNGSFIDKPTAVQMAQTLPGCPIVGYYSENQEDFRDHGDRMIIDGDGVKFKCLATPYGFVAPNARVWFQDFEDTDEFGNKIIHTYLMTEGYLWTEQYQEAQKVINEGRPQSMELDEKTLKGYYSTDTNKGMDFFIINDAIFSKLCILGEDVEPCFEGASVTSPKISSTFSKGDRFTHTLFTMMEELKELTSINEGGTSMAEKEYVVLDSNKVVEPEITEKVNFSEEKLEIEGKKDLEDNDQNENIIVEENFVKKEEKEEEDQDSKEENDKDNEEEEDDDKKKKIEKNTLEEKYALLEQEIKELQTKYTALEAENATLASFKLSIEDKEKDNLINSFYMLSDEDKADIIANKSKYSLDDIEKELSVICVRKKVNFNLDEEKDSTKKVVPTTFNLNNMDDNFPAWLKAVENRRNVD